jgi:hypothetical protein
MANDIIKDYDFNGNRNSQNLMFLTSSLMEVLFVIVSNI